MKYTQFKNNFILSFKVATPIIIGYIPLGLASGILSQKAGLSPLEIMLLSFGSYSGSGQFITASLLLSSASFISIVITNFVINCRYILMSSTLSPYFNRTNKWFLALFAHGITDETFAMNLINFKENDKWTTQNALFVNMLSLISWISSNVIGSITGTAININDIIINFILTSMFICLLVIQIKDKLYILAAVISGIVALILSHFTRNNLYIIVATIISATICMFIEKKITINIAKNEEVNENVN